MQKPAGKCKLIKSVEVPPYVSDRIGNVFQTSGIIPLNSLVGKGADSLQILLEGRHVKEVPESRPIQPLPGPFLQFRDVVIEEGLYKNETEGKGCPLSNKIHY